MPKTLWNEGRVVGYSAYELYVRLAIATDPEHPPVDEKTWLSSMLGMGNSMVLHIGTDEVQGMHYRDFPLPESARLCAASTIIASVFLGAARNGDADFKSAESGWATSISDYGILINNTSSSSPTGTVDSSSAIPPSTISNVSESEYTTYVSEYSKIVDGIVIQPGAWSDNTEKPPEKTLAPNMTVVPTLRIAFADQITHPFYIILTGFLNRSIISTLSKSTSSNSEDGVFLGPAEFPWSSKIVFQTPAAYASLYASTDYIRSFPKQNDAVHVTTDSVIDTETTNPIDFYAQNSPVSTIDINVQKLKTVKDGASVLATYSASDDLPPALYGMRLKSAVSNSNNPYIASVESPVYGLFHGDESDASKLDYTMSDSDWNTLSLVSKNKKDAGYTVSKTALKSIWDELCQDSYKYSYAKNLFYINIQDDCAFSLFPASEIQTLEQYIQLLKTPDSAFATYKVQFDNPVSIKNKLYYNFTIGCHPGTDSVFWLTIGVSSDDIALPNAMCPIDTTAPGTVKLYTDQDTAKTLEDSYPSNTALIRDSDYVIHQLNQYQDVVPVSKVETSSILNDLYVYNLSMINPYLVVDGNSPRNGVTVNALSGYDASKSVWDNEPNTYTITYNEETLSGTYLQSHPEEKLKYNEPVVIVKKRIVGYLSDKIKNLCGYEYDPDTKKLKSGGYWDNAVLILSTIPESRRTDYYYIVPSTRSDTTRTQDTFAWPVRKSDNYIDVTVQYRIRIFVTKTTNSGVISSEYKIPSMSNTVQLPDGTATQSGLLGSMWNNGSSSDGLTYNHGWAYIHTDDQVHTILKDAMTPLNGQNSCIYEGDTLLPMYNLYHTNMTASDVFGVQSMTNAGILSKFRSMSLHDFLVTAITTDMGTDQTLNNNISAHRENLIQSVSFYTNGKHESGAFTSAGDLLFTLQNKVSTDTVEKTMLLSVPSMYQDSAGNAPQCAMIQTGNLKSRVLSLSDHENSPYGLYGTSGTIQSKSVGKLTWMQLLNALAGDKTLDLLTDQIRQLISALSTCGDGEWKIKIENGKITLV